MTDRSFEVIADGLAFPEGPRWHDGRLWFSDIHVGKVLATDLDGKVEEICSVPGLPSGLGFLPDGRALIVSVTDRRLLRLEDNGSLSEVADIRPLTKWTINDMVVDGRGRAYIGDVGFELGPNAQVSPGQVVLVEPSGAARVAAEEMMFPNGSMVTPDGSTLIVGETYGARLTAFEIADDGSLSRRRVWAQLPRGSVPDGSCLDAEGCVWSASPTSNDVIRIREGGEVVERISTGDRGAYACMLGGPDRRTLLVCTARSFNPTETVAAMAGRIEAVEVEVPGAGWP